MAQFIDVLSSPEEALCLKDNIITSCLFDPIEAICERSITLCYLFKIYMSNKEIANTDICNLMWQLQGNTDILDLYLKNYLISQQYEILHYSIKAIWKLCSEITFQHADLNHLPIQSATNTLHLIVKVKHFFKNIKIYCYNLNKSS